MSFRVETDRLLIRPWQPDERPVFERFVTDGEMIRYISHGRVWDKARVDAYFERQSRYLTEHGCCLGAAMLKENNEIIGSGGIQPLENAGVFEFGWSIWKDYWNQGLATEMALSLKEYAFKVLKLPLFVAIIDPPNRAS
ncbi:MAG: GNAT family N-acetyltransferase, partial [Gammaproteobacteria bacterium]|nr:GNAT family N-acetyltransferase [Gammaproteobacteria bacterium]